MQVDRVRWVFAFGVFSTALEEEEQSKKDAARALAPACMLVASAAPTNSNNSNHQQSAMNGLAADSAVCHHTQHATGRSIRYQ